MAEPNIAEAESNASLLAIAEAQPYKWLSQISQKPTISPMGAIGDAHNFRNEIS